VGVRRVKAVEGSNGVGSESASRERSGDGSGGRREGSEGDMVEKSGRRASVCADQREKLVPS